MAATLVFTEDDTKISEDPRRSIDDTKISSMELRLCGQLIHASDDMGRVKLLSRSDFHLCDALKLNRFDKRLLSIMLHDEVRRLALSCTISIVFVPR
jgi:hypothetical protein